MGEYVLGTGGEELARLRFQEQVWGAVTARFLDRLGVGAGQRVVDLGCGPGTLLDAWLERLGPEGELLLVDASARWSALLAETLAARDLPHVRAVRATAEDVELEPGRYDLVFLRWVLSFVPEPADVLRRIARALRPGGLVAVQDYNHEGVSLFPESEGFRAVIRATRALYAKVGGDTWVGARLPGLFRAAGLSPVEGLETQVLAGGPGTPVFRWADLFFTRHADSMVAEGVLAPAERDRFAAEWAERRADPDALFFSPILVGAAGRRP